MNADARFGTWEQAVLWLRNQPDQAELVVAGYYDDPLVDAAERYRGGEEWQAVRALLAGRSGRALDVGAGRGIASYALAREGFEVTALEPDDSMLVGGGAIRQMAATTALPIKVVQNFSEQLPFADGEFDVVFGRAVLHHMRNLNQAVRELARVLKPGGLLLTVREHVISRRADLPRFLDSHPLHRLYGGENAFLLSEYRDSLLAAGLKLSRIIYPLESPINYYPQTSDSLRREIAARAGRVLGFTGLWESVLRSDPVFALVRWSARWFDRRPGRLYSFVCTKPVIA